MEAMDQSLICLTRGIIIMVARENRRKRVDIRARIKEIFMDR
jgi:hypothetical protein